MKTLFSLFVSVLFMGSLYAQSTDIKLPTEADSISNFRVLNVSGLTRMQVNSDGGVYLGGELGVGVIPTLNKGVRLLWYPRKAAFRAGFTIDDEWLSTNIGNYSVAMGLNTTASGLGSTALGAHTTASGYFSTAIGCGVSTNNYIGACIIGDTSTTVITNSTTDNQMTMRFSGGYRLFSNAALTTGVYMNSGISGWSNICDRNKKENFRPINGEQILTKIKEMPITEWNYKGTDKSVKYIGPVAQDFYSAFHLGGTDSLGINSLCIDGVNIAAIQALEKRTAELQKANEKIAQLENQLLQQKIEQEKTNTILSERIDKLSNLISSSTTINNLPNTSNK